MLEAAEWFCENIECLCIGGNVNKINFAQRCRHCWCQCVWYVHDGCLFLSCSREACESVLITVGPTIRLVIWRRWRRNLASLAASESNMYDGECNGELLDCQEIGPFARKKTYPELDLRSSGPAAKPASQKPMGTSIGLPFVEAAYMRTRSLVPWI